MKAFLLAVLAVVMLGIAPPKYVADKIRNETVLITSDNLGETDGGGYECAGVIAGQPSKGHFYIVTAAHCSDVWQDEDGSVTVPNYSDMYATMRDGSVGIAFGPPSSYYGSDDIRLMEFWFPRTRHNTHAWVDVNNLVSYGDPLWICGHPEGLPNWSIQPSYFMGPAFMHDRVEWDNDYSALCPKCNVGDSGGGVWTDKGYLHGIVNSKLDDHVYYLPIYLVLQNLLGRT